MQRNIHSKREFLFCDSSLLHNVVPKKKGGNYSGSSLGCSLIFGCLSPIPRPHECDEYTKLGIYYAESQLHFLAGDSYYSPASRFGNFYFKEG